MANEWQNLNEMAQGLKGKASIQGEKLTVPDWNRFREELLDDLAWNAAVSPEKEVKDACRWVIRTAAHQFGLIPASINDLYFARGRKEAPLFTTPAVNIRGLTYLTSRAMTRAAMKINAGAFIFELARSEMGYTEQPPSEYAPLVIAGALREGYKGPIFIQGDHFQVKPPKYKENKEKELKAIEDLIEEAIPSGFFNIDIDASTMVDLKYPAVEEQQKLNSELSAHFGKFIRDREPEGVTISIGGEIGEVGAENSTPEELTAYLDQYLKLLKEKTGDENVVGVSKVSVQTGTSHGGTVNPDGSIAEVELNWDGLQELTRVCVEKYGIGGCVQHGASTLPEEKFDRFPEVGTIEIHLATGFQNIAYDHLPEEFVQELQKHCAEAHADEKKEGQTDAQHFYKTRKKAWGPFKRKFLSLDTAVLEKISGALEEKFDHLFEKLKVKDTRPVVDQFVKPKVVAPPVPNSVKTLAEKTAQAAL